MMPLRQKKNWAGRQRKRWRICAGIAGIGRERIRTDMENKDINIVKEKGEERKILPPFFVKKEDCFCGSAKQRLAGRICCI